MKKFQLSFLFLIAFSRMINAQVSHLVISQVYSAGGNSGAAYNRDYVELFNPTANAVSLTGHSIQYSTATGSTWTSRALSGSIAAHSYFLIQMTTSGTNGAPLPTPDVSVTNTDMASTAGKVALVSTTIALSGSCPTVWSIVDLVGYGASANCWEGSAPAPTAGSNTNSLYRANNGCTDTDNNTADFASAAAGPRNSASPINDCLGGASLPVRFSFFRATEKPNGIHLSWTNETEENVSFYVVERSGNGSTFHAIGELKAVNNDQTKTSYTYLDMAPLKGDNYYRIKAVESDGNIVYSSILRINNNTTGTGLAINPNPVNGNELIFRINNIPKGNYTVIIYNATGQEIASRLINHTGGSVSETILLGRLMKGIYCLKIIGSVQMQKQFLID